MLKPGGHILAFSAARTYHHLAVTLEQAGFEIRDQIMWIYSSGFPKSQDIGKQIQKKLGVKETKAYEHNSPRVGGDGEFGADGSKEQTVCTDPEAQQWAGWGTALKPAHEPIALARKPMKGNIRDNCQKYGTGALNIDATRVPYENEEDLKTYINNIAGPLERSTAKEGDGINMFEGKVGYKVQKGTVKRLPSAGNRTSSFHNATGGGETVSGGDGSPEFEANPIGRFPSNVIGEILQADYQKYFYCPKVSRKERHIGFNLDDIPQLGSTHPDDIKKHPLWEPYMGGSAEHLKEKIRKLNPNQGNNHPTVKPIELMKYLIKLITPPGGTVLDPFNGSGSTGCAAVELGHPYIGCELDPAYVAIAEKRIAAWIVKDTVEPKLKPVEAVANNFEALFQ